MKKDMSFCKSTLLMLGASLALASCGGGGGGGGETVGAVDTNPVTDNSESGQDADAVTPDDPATGIQDSASALICASSTPTEMSSIGNSLHVFNAAEGQCFGRRESILLERFLIPVETTQETVNGDDGNLLTVESTGRLVINRGVGISRDNFIVDVANPQSFPVCLERGEVVGAGVESVITPSVRILGDTYLGDLVSNSEISFFNECIPPLESRSIFGSFLSLVDPEEGESFPDFTQISMELSLRLPSESAVATEALTPGEFSWTTFPQNTALNVFPYTSTVTVLNLTDAAIPLSDNLARILYFDNEDYLIHNDDVSIRDFFDNSSDFTDEDTVASALGGIVGFSTLEGSLNQSVPGIEALGSGRLSGPATRVMLYVPRIRAPRF